MKWLYCYSKQIHLDDENLSNIECRVFVPKFMGGVHPSKRITQYKENMFAAYVSIPYAREVKDIFYCGWR